MIIAGIEDPMSEEPVPMCNGHQNLPRGRPYIGGWQTALLLLQTEEKNNLINDNLLHLKTMLTVEI